MKGSFVRALILALGLFAAEPAVAADTAPLAVVGQIHAPDGDWDHVSFSTENRRLYVARANGLMAVDVDTEKVTPILVPGVRTHVAVPLPGGDILITNGGTNSAILADGRDGHIKATIPAGHGPDNAVLDPLSGAVLVVNAESSDITIVDVKSHSAVGRIPVGGSLDGAAVDGAGQMFVNIRDAGQVAVIDLRNRKVGARYTLPGCEQPTAVAYGQTHRLLLIACANRKAKVISADDGRPVAELPIGAGADDVLFDDSRGLGFIPAGDGTLTVVRVDGPRDIAVAQTLNTADGARTVAIDPKSEKLYLPTAKLVTSQGQGGLQNPTPGTFGVLIVGPPAPK